MNKWQAGNRTRQVIVLRNDVSLQAGPHICHPLAWEEPVPETDKFPNMTNFLSVTIFLTAFPRMLTGNEASVKAHTWGSCVDLRHMLPGQVLWNRSGKRPQPRGLTIISAARTKQEGGEGVDLTPLDTHGVCANSKAGLTIKLKLYDLHILF